MKGRRFVTSYVRTCTLHVLKILPAVFLQKASEEEEAKCGEEKLSQVLGCLRLPTSSPQETFEGVVEL